MGGRGLPDLLQYYIGGGSHQFITILHRVFFQSLLQYYRFGRNMEELRPFSVLHMFLCSAKTMHFVSNLEKFSEYAILGKYLLDYFNIT